MLKQQLQQKLQQKLSPQQIQLIRLLELPAIELEERIKHELEDNPALEEGKDIADALAFANAAAGLSTEKFGAQGGMPTYDEVKEAMGR